MAPAEAPAGRLDAEIGGRSARAPNGAGSGARPFVAAAAGAAGLGCDDLVVGSADGADARASGCWFDGLSRLPNLLPRIQSEGLVMFSGLQDRRRELQA